MKNKLTLFLTLLMSLCLVFALSSCGENGDTDTNTATETQTENGSNTDTSTDTSADTETDTEIGSDTETDSDTDTGEPEHVHAEEIVPAVAPTCKETGLTEGKKCSECGEILAEQEVVPTTGHTEEIIPAVEPNCEEIGLTEGKKCSECGEILVEQEIVPATGHIYENDYCTICNEIKPSEGLEYTLSADATYYILSGIGTCTDTSLVIPSTYNNKPVIAIGCEAFYRCYSLTSVKIGNKVTSIGYRAFNECTSLTSITISNSVTSIGFQAFNGCDKLVEVYDLSELNIRAGSDYNGYAGHYAKVVHKSLEEESILKTTADGYVFAVVSEDEIYLIDYVGNETELTLPDNHNGNNYEIYRYAFYRDDITKVIIVGGVTSIGNYAFSGCDKLVEVYNLSLLNITVGSSDNGSVGYYAKVIHTSLDEESVLDTVDDYTFMTWEDKYYLVGYAGNDTELILPESYNGNNYEIYKAAFFQRDDITKITIPDSVTSIGEGAFSLCGSLASIVIPNSVTSIGDEAFYHCDSLESVTIGNSVTSIGNYAFWGCYKLVEVYNLSSLNITAGSSANGYAGWYAKVVHTESIFEIVDDYIFMTWEDKYYLVGYLGDETEITLPENYNGNKYEIYQYAFYNRDDITKVTIPDSVTSIGSSAFEDCESLTSVTIGNGVTSIGGNAFEDCESLTSIIIPDNVTTIGYKAFYRCYSLTSVNIGNKVTSIGNMAFYDCVKLVEVYDLSELNITVSSSANGYADCYAKVVHTSLEESILEIVDDYIFMTWEDKYYLVGYIGKGTEIIFPENYNGNKYEIYQHAFYNRDDITRVTIPDSVTSIGDCAFRYCYKLVEVYNLSSLNITAGLNDTGYAGYYAKVIHKSLDEESILEIVDDYIFMTWEDKYYLVGYIGKGTEIIFPENYNGNKYEIYQHAFYNRDDITRVTIPDSVTSIGNYAFYGCESLTSVTIGNSVTSIGNYAFYSCNNLTSVTIGNGVTTIGNSAFEDCESLTSIIIPDNVTSIEYQAFYDCDSLASVTIGNGVTTIGSAAFYDCNNLTSVTIGNSVTSIGGQAFYYCNSLTSIVIPDSVTSIGFQAFSLCGSLASIVIPNSVTSIGDKAFYHCDALISITIPDSVTSIGDEAFKDCYSLVRATIGNSVTSIGGSAFYRCASLTSITIGNSVTSIGSYAFSGCYSLTCIVIPNSVVSIGNNAFKQEEFYSRTIYCETESKPTNGWSSDWYSGRFVYVYWYSETEPTAEGNYWHYVDGVVTRWK